MPKKSKPSSVGVADRDKAQSKCSPLALPWVLWEAGEENMWKNELNKRDHFKTEEHELLNWQFYIYSYSPH